MSFLFSANDLARTRLCAARDCPQDAETGAALCARCARKASVRLHVVEQPEPYDPATHLECCTCRKRLPDDAFHVQSARINRRGRHRECRACNSQRRTRQRRALPADRLAEHRARDAARKRRALTRQRQEPS